MTEVDGQWQLRPPADLLAADRDIVLEWEGQSVDTPVETLLVESGGAADHALVLVRPPEGHEIDASEGLPTETLFVIDISGSMDGPSIEHARSALLAALERLRPTDRFALVAFNDHSAAFADRFLRADGHDLERARRWIRGLRAHGGTMIFPALLHGLGLFAAEPHARTNPDALLPVRRMIFLTDGAVANEGQMIERLARGLGHVRLHTFGIGYAPNRALMRKMAAVGGGLCTFIASVDEAGDTVDRFYSRLERPVWTDLRLEWTGVAEVQQSPERLPDLHAGEPLYVSARLEGARGSVGAVLRARSKEGPIERRLTVTRVDESVALSQRWARRRVETLLDSLHEGKPPDEVRPAVVQLGRAHHIVTPYTSLIAEEEIVTAATATHSTAVANALPQGSRLMQGALPRGGTDRPLRLRLGLGLLLMGGLVALVTRGGR
jgi:Ca-activated chloride channel family protein